jgi:hypothetical protein
MADYFNCGFAHYKRSAFLCVPQAAEYGGKDGMTPEFPAKGMMDDNRITSHHPNTPR